MNRIKVLMADDEEDILNVMAKKVGEAGYDVIKSSDGEEALEKIKSDDPDIVLLDLTMPKKDGYEVLKYIRENPNSSKWLPVIIVSAKNEVNDYKTGFSLEADHYISKPCSIEDILKSIQLMVSLIPHRKND